MDAPDRPLVWHHGEVKNPPFSLKARMEAGVLLRRLQRGEKLAMPHSRPMTTIGAGCHELRINDRNTTWRIIHFIDTDAIVILEVFNKKTRQTPSSVVSVCRLRLSAYKTADRTRERDR